MNVERLCPFKMKQMRMIKGCDFHIYVWGKRITFKEKTLRPEMFLRLGSEFDNL